MATGIKTHDDRSFTPAQSRAFADHLLNPAPPAGPSTLMFNNAPAAPSLDDVLQFDAHAPRTFLQAVPGAVRATSSVALNVTYTLAGFPLRTAWSAASGLGHVIGTVGSRALFGRKPAQLHEMQSRHRAERAAAVTASLGRYVAAAHPDDLPAWTQLQPTVEKILADYPALLAHARNVTGSRWVSAVRMPIMTRAPKAVVIDGLMKAAQTMVAAEAAAGKKPAAPAKFFDADFTNEPEAIPLEELDMPSQAEQTPVASGSRRMPRRQHALRGEPSLPRGSVLRSSTRMQTLGFGGAAPTHALRTASLNEAVAFENDDAAAFADDLTLAGLMRPMDWVCNRLAELSLFKTTAVTPAILTAFLDRDSLPPTELPVKVALLVPGTERVFTTVDGAPSAAASQLPFAVHAGDPTVRMLLGALLLGRTLPSDVQHAVESEIRLVVQLQAPNFLEDVAKKVVQLVSVDSVTTRDGKQLEVNASNLRALVHTILAQGEAGLGAGAVIDGKPLYDFLAETNVMRVVSDSPAFSRYVNGLLRSDSAATRRLNVVMNLLQIMIKHYFDQADLAEAAVDLVMGSAIGAIYELASEKIFVPNPGEPFYADALWYVNILGATLIDLADNYLGRRASAVMGLRAKGKKATPEAMYGPGAADASFVEKAIRFPRLVARGGVGKAALADAEAAPASTRPALPDREVASAMAGATRASIKGALVGGLLQVGPQIPISDPSAKLWQLMLATAGGTVATSLSIPFDERAQIVKRMRAHKALLDADIIRAPGGAGDDASTRKRMLDDAIRDITASIEGQSSVKAFTLSPTIALLWPLTLIGPQVRPVLQPIIFGMGPGYENLLTLGLAGRVKSGFDKGAREFEKVAFAEALQGAAVEQSKLDASALGAAMDGVRAGFAPRYDRAIEDRWSIWATYGFAFWLPRTGV